MGRGEEVEALVSVPVKPPAERASSRSRRVSRRCESEARAASTSRARARREGCAGARAGMAAACVCVSGSSMVLSVGGGERV